MWLYKDVGKQTVCLTHGIVQKFCSRSLNVCDLSPSFSIWKELILQSVLHTYTHGSKSLFLCYSLWLSWWYCGRATDINGVCLTTAGQLNLINTIQESTVLWLELLSWYLRSEFPHIQVNQNSPAEPVTTEPKVTYHLIRELLAWYLFCSGFIECIACAFAVFFSV